MAASSSPDRHRIRGRSTAAGRRSCPARSAPTSSNGGHRRHQVGPARTSPRPTTVAETHRWPNLREAESSRRLGRGPSSATSTPSARRSVYGQHRATLTEYGASTATPTARLAASLSSENARPDPGRRQFVEWRRRRARSRGRAARPVQARSDPLAGLEEPERDARLVGELGEPLGGVGDRAVEVRVVEHRRVVDRDHHAGARAPAPRATASAGPITAPTSAAGWNFG